MRRRRSTPIVSLSTHPVAYVTLPALRVYWQVDYRTLRKWVQAGALPAYRFGRLWRVRTEDARAFEQHGQYRAS